MQTKQNAKIRNRKKKKIMRMTRAHIWPSVVFLIASAALSFLAGIILAAFVVSYFAMDRMSTNIESIKTITNIVSISTDTSEDALDASFEGFSGDEEMFLLDENGKVLTGQGDATYIWESATIGDGVLLYLDRERKVLTPDFDFNMDELVNYLFRDTDVASQLLVKVGGGFSLAETKKVLYAEPFWIGIRAGENTLLVKSHIPFYLEDFVIAFLLGVVIFAIVLVPVFFLFINVLNNVRNQRQMTALLYMDRVTGKHNWMYFDHTVTKTLRSGRARKSRFAIVSISLPKYRNFCTYHGVSMGEVLLEKTNGLIQRQLSSMECVAHTGEAEFAVLLQCNDKDECVARVSTMLDTIPERLKYEALVFHAGIFFVEPVEPKANGSVPRRKLVDVDEYYNSASTARSTIADEEQTAIASFDEKLLEDQLWEHKVEEKMQQALDNKEFLVYIQPKYNPVTEELVGGEALVRWVNNEDGFISPGRFIPIFERNGFITELDDYMISHVAELQSKWLQAGKKVVPISVNVSRAHFANPDLAEHICTLVDKYELPHHLLEIELTESAFFDDKEALLSTVRKLKEMGFDISMDDFGAGYSSLNSLKDLPLDVLKLDADFFRGEDGEERGEIVVSQAIRLAKKLNMKIVAEGVEKKNQVDFLAQQNCDMIQGYYFAKPMPAEEYEERI